MEERNEKTVVEKETPLMKRSVNIKYALILLCLAIIGQSMMVTGALNVSISTIERAFRYNSFLVAFIDTSYNISFALCAFILGYAVTSNKMKCIGAGTFTMSLGCLLFILPALINNFDGVKSTNATLLCETKDIFFPIECKFGSKLYLFLMCLAYCLIGIGAAPLHTLAVSFMDENTSHSKVGLFTGVYYACAAVGPAFSFVLYSFVIKLPIQIYQSADEILTSDSENWIGAYWLIYLMGFAILFLVSIPLVLFPNITNQRSITSKIPKPSKSASISRFFEISKNISRNTPFIFVCIGMFFDGMMNNALGVFFSKYIEAQFRVPSGKAALYGGVVLVLGAAIGLLSGGFIIKTIDWPQKKVARLITLLSFIGAVSLGFLFFRCPNVSLHGVEYNPNNVLNYSTSCAAQCHCNIKDYFPVCANDEKTYYSPCSIGCANQIKNGGEFSFTNCACIDDKYINSTLTQGTCKSKCQILILFLVMGFLCMVIEFIIYIPQITLTMRVLDDTSRLCGLAIQQIVLRTSYFLGPLILGPLIDRSCIIFSHLNECETSSNCINYDLGKLSMYVAISCIFCKLSATIFLWICSFHIKTPTNEDFQIPLVTLELSVT